MLILKSFKHLVQIFVVLLAFLIVYDLLQCVEMVVLEDILFEVLEFLVAKRTLVVSIDGLFDAGFAIYMPTTCNVTIVDRIETHCALEFGLQLVSAYPKRIFILLLALHLLFIL